MDQLLAVGGTEIPADSYIEPEQFYLMSMCTFYIHHVHLTTDTMFLHQMHKCIPGWGRTPPE